MTKILILPTMILVCILMTAGGCGGPTGGSVTENAEQSAVDAYKAEAAAPVVDPDEAGQ